MDLSQVSDDELMAAIGKQPKTDLSAISDDELMAAIQAPEQPKRLELIGADASIEGPEQPSPFDIVRGTPEVALALASGTIAEPVAGLAGVVGSLLPGERGQGARFVESTREALTFEPRSDAGKQAMGVAGEALAPIGDAIQGAQQAIGDKAFDLAGGDSEQAALAGAAGQASVDATLAAVPFIGAALKRSKNVVIQSKRADIAKKIRDRIGDTDTAKFRIDEAGNVVGSKTAKAAIKQGFDEGVVATIKVASPEDSQKMLKMLNISERGKKNAKFGVTNWPSDVVGDSIAERLNMIRRVNKRSGRAVDDAAKSLKSEPLNVGPVVDDFIANIESKGVQFDPKTGDLNFAGSDFEGLAGPQRALGRLVSRMRNTRTPDAYDAHRLKKFIDENVTFGKSQEGLGGQVERIIKDLRRNIDGALDQQYPNYARANQTYSDTIQALDNFQSVAGTKIDIFGPNADKALGTVSRVLMSNYKSRINTLDSIVELDKVAAKYGGAFSDDIVTQAMFFNELNDVFGAAAKTSLQGEIEKGAANAARGGVKEAATEAVLGTGKRILGRTDEKAYKAMRELLRSQLKQAEQPKPPTLPARR